MLVSATEGCQLDASSAFTDPIDTAFYLSCSAFESAAALFAVKPSGLSFAAAASPRGVAGAALTIAAGSYLTSPFSVGPTLAVNDLFISTSSISGAPFSISAWVSCPSSLVGIASVLEYGAAGPPASPAKAALLVASPLDTTAFSFGGANAVAQTVIATGVRLLSPCSIAVAGGQAYVADSSANAVFAVSLATGVAKLLAGSATGVAAYSDGAASSAAFSAPAALAVGPSGLIYVADCGNNRIRTVSPSGTVSTLAGSGAAGSSNSPGTSSTWICPSGIAIATDGSYVYVADTGNNRIRKVNPTLAVTSLCGSGAPGSSDGTGAAALFSGPTALALSGSTLFVADTGNGRVRAVTGLTTSNGIVTTLAASASSGLAVRGVAVDLVGNVFFSAGNTVRRISAAAPGAATVMAGAAASGVADGIGGSASFSAPVGLALIGSDLLVADTGSSRLRRVLQSVPQPGPLPVCDGSWHHAAVTYTADGSSSALSAFVDGNLVGGAAFSLAIPALNGADPSLALRIGWDGLDPVSAAAAKVAPFAGSLSDLRIYPYPLAPAQVGALHALGAAAFLGCGSGATLSLGVCVPTAATPSASATTSAGPSSSPAASVVPASRSLTTTSSASATASATATPSAMATASATASASATATSSPTSTSALALVTAAASSTSAAALPSVALASSSATPPPSTAVIPGSVKVSGSALGLNVSVTSVLDVTAAIQSALETSISTSAPGAVFQVEVTSITDAGSGNVLFGVSNGRRLRRLASTTWAVAFSVLVPPGPQQGAIVGAATSALTPGSAGGVMFEGSLLVALASRAASSGDTALLGISVASVVVPSAAASAAAGGAGAGSAGGSGSTTTIAVAVVLVLGGGCLAYFFRLRYLRQEMLAKFKREHPHPPQHPHPHVRPDAPQHPHSPETHHQPAPLREELPASPVPVAAASPPREAEARREPPVPAPAPAAPSPAPTPALSTPPPRSFFGAWSSSSATTLTAVTERAGENADDLLFGGAGSGGGGGDGGGGNEGGGLNLSSLEEQVANSITDLLPGQLNGLVAGAASALDALAPAVPLVGLALSALSAMLKQLGTMADASKEVTLLRRRLERLRSLTQRCADDAAFVAEHAAIFEGMASTLRLSTQALRRMQARGRLGRFISAGADVERLGAIDRALTLHVAELTAALQVETLHAMRTLSSPGGATGMSAADLSALAREAAAEALAASPRTPAPAAPLPPLPPFSMSIKLTDLLFDPPLAEQLPRAKRGSYGVVVFAVWREHKLPVAVKLIAAKTPMGLPSISVGTWLAEAELMRRLRDHRSPKTGLGPSNIVTLYGIGAASEDKENSERYLVVSKYSRSARRVPPQLCSRALTRQSPHPHTHAHPNPRLPTHPAPTPSPQPHPETPSARAVERLEGSLRDVLDGYLAKGRQPPLAQALQWLLDTARGLEECHEANVVHSDVKAANTLVDERRAAKIGDLGAGRITRDISATASMTGSTAAGNARGSVLWLASELVDEPSMLPSKASDVYAYGVMAHEVLTCRLPYGAPRDT